jgi:hypothetical protein
MKQGIFLPRSGKLTTRAAKIQAAGVSCNCAIDFRRRGSIATKVRRPVVPAVAGRAAVRPSPRDFHKARSGGGFMVYVPAWQRLSDAIESVMAGAGCSRDKAKTDICQAIADRTVNIQGKLSKHITRPTTPKTVLEGKDFEIPAKIKPADFDWERSRPLKSWVVRREIFGFPGHWEVAWIEVCRADVTKVLCKRSSERTSSMTGTKSRSQPARERTQKAINELYPKGLPEPATLPNTLLCRRVGEKLKGLGLPEVSDDTILRAAGRRRR